MVFFLNYLNPILTMTTISGGPLQVVSNKDREELALARIKAVRTRPSTLAAKEFFAGERNWKSLPLRIRRLVDVFDSWVRVLSFSLLRSFIHIISYSLYILVLIDCRKWIS